MNDAQRLRYIAGNIEQDQREHSARYLREIADRIDSMPTFESIRNAAMDEVKKMIMDGRFLHDQAPPKLFAKEVCKAINEIKTE